MTFKFLYGDREIEYSIALNVALGSKVRIHVHPNGSVEVETPSGKSDAEILKAVSKRARWIAKNIEYFDDIKKHALPRQYVSGETHFYLGRRYQLKVFEQPSLPSKVLLKGGQIQVSVPCKDPVSVRRRLGTWYKQRADHYFRVQMNRVVQKVSWVVECPTMKLVPMKTQWGSCSPKGTIHLNPLLVKAPRECIDYVLVHELCHLLEHNHSQRFYSLLTQQLPDWRHSKAKLDGMSELLLAE